MIAFTVYVLSTALYQINRLVVELQNITLSYSTIIVSWSASCCSFSNAASLHRHVRCVLLSPTILDSGKSIKRPICCWHSRSYCVRHLGV